MQKIGKNTYFVSLSFLKGEQGTAELGVKTVLKQTNEYYVSRDRSYLPVLKLVNQNG